MQINYVRPWVPEYQRRIIDSPARFTVTEAATKVGKTGSHIIWGFEKTLNLQTNQRGWWIAPVYQQAEIAFSRMRAQVSEPNFFKVNETKLRLTLPTGAIIEFKSAEKPDNLYGDDVYWAVFDEFTRAREDAWTALRTTLTATQAPCKFIGNVRGKNNWGYKLGLKARSGDKGYEYHKITAMDAVHEGILTLEEIQQAKSDLPENAFKQLYQAEALDDQANPFGISHIANCIKPIYNTQPRVYGIDLAKSTDWTVIIGLDNNGNICFYERFQKDWGQTRQTIIDRVGSTLCAIDSTGVGDPIVEDIQRACGQVEGYHFTQKSKQQLMEGLASAIQKNEISVLDGYMREELESFEFEYSRTGVRYSAPQGVHDDTVCALGLANYKLRGTKGASPTLMFYE